ncbi:MAG: tetratricopeptide repeat protein [Labilithrix sp.]|nr:tetratricopeptide repeat protein [Labilithrix sp.]MCW5814042.1 tetratricopeptide repeat protein [Labilithrix sp.]
MRSALVVAALVVGIPAVAYAEPTPQDISQARDLGQQGQAAYEAGNFAESERLFTAASNLYPAAPTLTLGAARAQVKQGKLVLARESYNKIIREQGNNPSASQAFKDAVAAAQSEVNDVAAKIARVTIKIEGGAENARVTIDGETVPPAGLGVARPVDPGSHTVKAEAPGYTPGETTFEVAEAGSAEATLSLTKVPDAPPPPPPAGGAVTAPPKRDRTLAIVALGVGGAGLVFGGVTGALAMSKHGDLDTQCPAGRCPPSASGDVDSFRTMATLSTVGFIVGAVGVAAGAVLWFTAPKKQTGFEWHPYVGGVAGRF